MARRWILPAFLALAAAGFMAWRLPFHPRPEGPQRFQVLAPEDPGLQALAGDLVEAGGNWIPVETSKGAAPPPGTRVLTLRRSRNGVLTLDASLDGRALPHMEGTPPQVFGALFRKLDLAAPGEDLLPAETEDFAELTELMGTPPATPREGLDRRAQSLVQRLPHCASARMAQALYITDRPLTLEGRQRCEQNLREALDARPHHPRAIASLAYFLTNTGRQREALDLLAEGLPIHPRSPHLLGSLAYAARTTGLLQVADRALDRMTAATGLPRGHGGLADNTRLYLGDLDAFEKGLPRLENDYLRSFYQGYARLLHEDRSGALAFFRTTEAPSRGHSLFLRLSAAYRLELEGRRDESLRALEQMEAERVQIRVPDGELTFKVAEAYGFLGEPRRALEVMGKAAVQGFGCTRWYEQSPFLGEARKLPAWPRLHQTLQERQEALEARFPLQRFEP